MARIENHTSPVFSIEPGERDIRLKKIYLRTNSREKFGKDLKHDVLHQSGDRMNPEVGHMVLPDGKTSNVSFLEKSHAYMMFE